MLALAGTLVLAGCNGGRDDENARDDNVMDELDERPVDTVPFNRVEEEPSAPENKVQAPQISEEQQIQDDAEASGMTSRLPDETETPPPVQESVMDAAGAGNSAAQ